MAYFYVWYENISTAKTSAVKIRVYVHLHYVQSCRMLWHELPKALLRLLCEIRDSDWIDTLRIRAFFMVAKSSSDEPKFPQKLSRRSRLLLLEISYKRLTRVTRLNRHTKKLTRTISRRLQILIFPRHTVITFEVVLIWTIYGGQTVTDRDSIQFTIKNEI